MAHYNANRLNKTLTLHKKDCVYVPRDGLLPCGCYAPGDIANQEWFCEDHISVALVRSLMHNKQWVVRLCDSCYAPRENDKPLERRGPIRSDKRRAS